MSILKPSAYPNRAGVPAALLGIAAMAVLSPLALRQTITEAMAAPAPAIGMAAPAGTVAMAPPAAPAQDANGAAGARAVGTGAAGGARADGERADGPAPRWAALRQLPWRACLAIGLLATAVVLALVPIRRRRSSAWRAAPRAATAGRDGAARAMPTGPHRFDLPEAANDRSPPHAQSSPAPSSPIRVIPVMAIGDRPGHGADAAARPHRPRGAPDDRATGHPDTRRDWIAAVAAWPEELRPAAPTPHPARPDPAGLAADLAAALARDEFTLHYQPVVNLASGAVTGMEALLRWHHPRHGVIAPGLFIPIAETHGLIGRLGDWVLRRACADAATWPDSIRLAVNLSAAQFHEPSLVPTIGAALAEAGLPPDRLELEITEAALLDDASRTLDTLHALRAMGVRIAMDDAGTARSSLRHLRRFPFDRIKLDRSFVRDIADRPQGEIVQAVSGLGSSLGMAITAEGVETDEQLEALRRDGCQEVQGYLFSRPVPMTRVGTVLARLSRHEAAQSTRA